VQARSSTGFAAAFRATHDADGDNDYQPVETVDGFHGFIDSVNAAVIAAGPPAPTFSWPDPASRESRAASSARGTGQLEQQQQLGGQRPQDQLLTMV
jgi:hypothetical protein